VSWMCIETGKALIKAMQTLPYFKTKLIKTIVANAPLINCDNGISYEIENVLVASGEGWFFLLPAGARKQ
jgi:hypothetical protein